MRGCGAALGTPWSVGARLHVGAVGTESSAQKMGCPSPLSWGSSPLSPHHHPNLPALHVLGKRPDPSRPKGPELGTALRGQESLLFSWLLVLPETGTRLPCPSLPRQGDSLGSWGGEGPPILSSEHLSKEMQTSAQTKPPPVLRTHMLAAFGCRWDRLTLLLQSQAESWEGSSSQFGLPGHLGRGEHVGFTALPNRVISAGRFTGREMSLLRCSLSMAVPFLSVLLPDLALPTSVTGSALGGAGSL